MTFAGYCCWRLLLCFLGFVRLLLSFFYSFSFSCFFLSFLFLSVISIYFFCSSDLGLDFFFVFGFGACDLSWAWWPARDSTREDFRSLSELVLGALPSPFPPFAPVTSV